jgi:hypothetical protein
MRFHLDQHIAAPPDAVALAFTDASYYASLDQLPKLGTPQVLDREEQGPVVSMRIRYRFTGEVSSAVRAVIDPGRLSWIETADHDLTTRTVRFRMDADHYGDRFRCTGSYRVEAHGDGTRRACDGELTVKMPIVGRRVESAIVSGLQEHLEAEVPFLERWLDAGR